MNKKEFFVVLIATCIVILVWVASDILHAQANYTVDPETEKLAVPFDATFDQTTLDKVKLLSTPTLVSPTPSPTLTPTPTTRQVKGVSTPSASKR